MNIRNALFRVSTASALAAIVFAFDTVAALAAYAPPPLIPTCTSGGPTPCTDYFGVANYANSPLPAGSITSFTITTGGTGYTTAPTVTITDAAGSGSGATAVAGVLNGSVTAIVVVNGGTGYIAPQVTIGGPGTGAAATAAIGGTLTGGIRKFVDTLPGLGAGSRPAGTALGANNLGQYMPLATPDTTTFSSTNSDYYVLGLKDHTEQMHTDLPATTKIRGYYQVNGTDHSTHYLGPMILATKDRPVRVLFQNELPTGSLGDLFIPTDTTYMGAGLGPDGSSYYTQNRATLHLHGGATPWISDGTPHQWITPPNETNTPYQKGDSFMNVPDMVGTGKPILSPSDNDGKGTFFWTNQQGGRLMFYHDHAYGATRTNVYAGEAAGYLLVDPAEETALAAGTAPGTIITNPATGAIVSSDLSHLVPLIIQDKTFVPQPTQLAATDPTWDTAKYGGYGNFWFPHVYMTNQDPADPKNMNAFGRWDYGPWFFPPQASLTAGPVTIPCVSAAHPGVTVACPIFPNPSGTPESFMDTPVINGTAYPVLHVAPAAYRFQILIAANDRTWNLSWFTADATGKEVPLVPAVTPAVGSPTPLCSLTTQITNPGINGLAIGALDATGMPLNGTGLQANCWPSTWPLTFGTGGTAGLTGIVPDPRNAGPAWIMIGTEGGLLPAPVVIPPTPVLYETNPKSITVGSVASHGLLLGPAERADVIVDFSQFAGKTLILYNDGPAPIPAYDTRYDYYTGDADNFPTGGAPPTLPGYGPNTRTIMQVVVDQANANTTPFSLNSLNAKFATGATAGLFQATQPNIIVPGTVYNSAYNKTYTNTFMKLQDNYFSYINFDGTLPSIAVTAGGTGYTTPPAITFGAGCTTAPVATATVSGGAVTAITLTSPGAGCTTVPTVTIGGPGTGATAIVGAYIHRKAIQELFTSDYGRMNATLGTELPLTNFLTQTTIPLAYIDPPTEVFRDGETQLWRVTHNGVDTHLIHFHLFNVQIINRVGWDGTVRPPDANELGWKDTVKMNPLEDIIVALTPVKQTLPFALADSVRLLDTTQPAGTTAQFTAVDPFTNLPMPVTNQIVNFGSEYVWHCHILGHEENDMMRPMVFQLPPETPTALTAAYLASPSRVNLTWTNNAISATSFNIQRATNAAFTLNLQNFTLGTASMTATPFAQGAMTFTDTTVALGATYYYRVAATKTFPARQSPTWAVPPQTENLSSPTTSTSITIPGSTPVASVILTAAPTSPRVIGTSVTFTATASGGSGTPQYYFTYRNPVTGVWSIGQAYSTNNTWIWNTTGLPAGTYKIQAWARNVGSSATYEAYGQMTYSITIAPVSTVSFTSITPPSPQAIGARANITFNATATGGSGTPQYYFTWRNPVTGVWSVGQAYSSLSSWTWNPTGLPNGIYKVQVWARNAGSTATYEAYSQTLYTLR